MRIVCIGGGPAGLYFGLLMKQANAGHHITVVERNKPFDTFGWGVVFSDATLGNMRRNDPVTADSIERAFNHWDDIEVRIKGRRMRTTGHGFVGIGRKTLLNILQHRAQSLGVELAFEHEVSSDLDYPDADLIVASDGVNSKVRERSAHIFEPDIAQRPNRYIWLGVKKRYDAFTFDFQRTEHGWFQAHIYKYDDEHSTFIVETTEPTFDAHALGDMDQAESIAFCEQLFAEVLDGAPLLSNAKQSSGSAWLNFSRLICERWHFENGRSQVVLMGDAAHTAHFAIGSGTKLALEDAIELTHQIVAVDHDPSRLDEALEAYETTRRVDV
ncbi:MAG: FAD-dependent monooxygenase, partial [Gemmatimonadaceae bacterium]